MNPWWDSIQAARKRGKFTMRDHTLAWHSATCAVGEATGQAHNKFVKVGLANVLLSGGFTRAVQSNDMDGAENILVKIEDEVLRMKREGLL